jgi:uridylate kinase
MSDSKLKFNRVLLKLSGETFGGSEGKGLDTGAFKKLASYLSTLHRNTHIELAIVVGAGNLFRGRDVKNTNFDRGTADYIGMLGTVMNALALQAELEKLGSVCRVLSSLPVASVCEPFIRRKAIKHLEKGRIVILAGGTGSPFFTTDSSAALKAAELNCEIILKGSNVEGVFTSDPKINPDATMYSKLSYQEALEKGLTVMDATAFALCQTEHIPVIVFNMNDFTNIEKILRGEQVGTIIK